ncbi:MAG: hypothetical protein LAO78_28525 [Acidobacteriia bacterium]|nr:hypothetical protein [Terriglobia bacterium]
MAQGKPFKRPQHQGNPSQNADLVAYFSEVATTGRGNCIDDVVYIAIDEAERHAFPRLAECYGVAIQLQAAVDGEKIQCFVFQTESEFDADVLAALSPVGTVGHHLNTTKAVPK